MIKMRRTLLFFGFVFIILSINIISAEIMLSQPSALYNLGDSVDIQATIKENQQSSGFFNMNLACGDGTRNFYRNFINVKANEEMKIETSLLLTKSLANAGNCNIEALFLNEEQESQKFLLSDKITVSLNLGNLSAEAGKEIIVRGNARKENGGLVEGFLNLGIENTGINIIRTITNGSFETNFSFPENIKSGSYILEARVYDEVEGIEANNGEAKITLSVKQTAKKIDIAISNQNVKPGESVIFKPIIYDQANDLVAGEVGLKFYDDKGELFFQKILNSGEEKEIYFETNSNAGYWSVEAAGLGLEARRDFYIEELKKASFNIGNGTLTIENIGNVPYKNTIQISIGEITETENLELEVGESKSFKLNAPDGNYKVSVNDGIENLKLDGVALTGDVIGLSEISTGVSMFTKYPIVWLFLIVVLGMFLFVLGRRVVKRNSYSFPSSSSSHSLSSAISKKEAREIPKQEDKKEKDDFIPASGKQVERAEHTVVLDGRKEVGSLLTIRIKDLNSIRKICRETINNIFRTITENKGAIYETSDYLIGIFSSQTTKTFGNEMIAVRIGKQVEEILKEHNRKFRQKIDYGISLNSGDLILKKDAGLLKFTGIGNSLSLAKKTSELANNELLLSENMHNKVMNEVKAEKEIRQGVNIYHIGSISNREKYNSFISGFLERQKAGK
jgi:hypothetical protein